jgi:hypothetical protein
MAEQAAKENKIAEVKVDKEAAKKKKRAEKKVD